MQLMIDAEELRPLVEQVVRATVSELSERSGDDRLLTEADAAKRLGMSPESLAGERRNLRITAKVGPRGRIFYTPTDIRSYINSRQDWSPAA